MLEYGAILRKRAPATITVRRPSLESRTTAPPPLAHPSAVFVHPVRPTSTGSASHQLYPMPLVVYLPVTVISTWHTILVTTTTTTAPHRNNILIRIDDALERVPSCLHLLNATVHNRAMAPLRAFRPLRWTRQNPPHRRASSSCALHNHHHIL